MGVSDIVVIFVIQLQSPEVNDIQGAQQRRSLLRWQLRRPKRDSPLKVVGFVVSQRPATRSYERPRIVGVVKDVDDYSTTVQEPDKGSCLIDFFVSPLVEGLELICIGWEEGSMNSIYGCKEKD